MNKTKWWFIIFGFSKCGLPVSKLFLRSVFNFNLQLVVVTSSWRHHGSWRWRWKQKIFLRPENESAQRFYEIWLLGRLHMARFSWDMGVSVWNHSWLWYSKIMARTGIFGLLVCALYSVNSSDIHQPSMILTHRRDTQSRSSQKGGPRRDFHRARQRANNPPGGLRNVHE